MNFSPQLLNICLMVQHVQQFIIMHRCFSRIDDVEGIESLRWEDQQKIRKYVESVGQPTSNTIKDKEYGIEVSQTSRATCRHCGKKIVKGEVGFYVSFNVIEFLLPF